MVLVLAPIAKRGAQRGRASREGRTKVESERGLRGAHALVEPLPALSSPTQGGTPKLGRKEGAPHVHVPGTLRGDKQARKSGLCEGVGGRGKVWESVGGHGTVWEGVGRCGRAWESVGGPLTEVLEASRPARCRAAGSQSGGCPGVPRGGTDAAASCRCVPLV